MAINQVLRPAITRNLFRLSPWISHSFTGSASARQLSQTHRMSSSSTKKEWLAHVPDHANALEKRMSVRPQHLEKIKPMIEDRTIVFGGATLSEKGEMSGSFLLVRAETEAEVREILQRDVYTNNGVWNFEEVRIWPFRSAFRTPVE